MTKKFLSLLIVFSLCISLLFALSASSQAASSFTYTSVAAFSGSPYAEVNGNVPGFTPEEYTYSSFETYSELDDLGRCGEAYACVGTDLMPTGPSGSLSAVTPTGFVNAKYGIVSGGYLYNRCHLIAFQLAGETANPRNLITGTRYLNVNGMLPFEEAVAEYVRSTENHVLYRVTPVFHGDDLVARGVLMEALSMEDGGAGVRFCVFCYNVQPGISIDYATGRSALADETPGGRVCTVAVETVFVVNLNSHKYHLPSCRYASLIGSRNKDEVTATPARMAEQGYDPCARCRPDLAAAKKTYLYGDANTDGTLSAVDARLVLRFAVRLEAFSELQKILSDVDSDGAVTPADARGVLRAAVGLAVL